MPTPEMRLTRRELLEAAVLAGAALPRIALGAQARAELPPVRAITHGPKQHWFGYYDKLEFDPSGRYVLGMEVDFQHRSPAPDEPVCSATRASPSFLPFTGTPHGSSLDDLLTVEDHALSARPVFVCLAR